MRASVLFGLTLVALVVCGCRPASTPPPTSAATLAPATNAWAFEGTYVDTNYNDQPKVTFQAGRYTGGLPTNPGGSINGSGSYSVRELESGKWELALTKDLGGSTTLILRQEGRTLLIRDTGWGGETRVVKQ